MGTTNTLDLNNRVTNMEKAIDGLTASDIMMSDGVTSVEDRIGNILFVEKTISNVSVSSEWGSMFLGQKSLDISDLGLNNAPDVISATLSSTASTTASLVAECLVADVTKNVVPISLVRATSGTVSGKIMLMLKSNG